MPTSSQKQQNKRPDSTSQGLETDGMEMKGDTLKENKTARHPEPGRQTKKMKRINYYELRRVIPTVTFYLAILMHILTFSPAYLLAICLAIWVAFVICSDTYLANLLTHFLALSRTPPPGHRLRKSGETPAIRGTQFPLLQTG